MHSEENAFEWDGFVKSAKKCTKKPRNYGENAKNFLWTFFEQFVKIFISIIIYTVFCRGIGREQNRQNLKICEKETKQ